MFSLGWKNNILIKNKRVQYMMWLVSQVIYDLGSILVT